MTSNPIARNARQPFTSRAFVALGLVLLVLWLVPILRPAALIDPDEGLHAAISQEMVTTGDYVTPRFLGEPFLDKPILFFWTQALSLRVFGNHEAAVRLPGLVFGTLGALSIGWLASVVLGDRRGWMAAPFYATMLAPIALMEVPVHDVALVPFVTAALLGFWRAARSPRTRRVFGWSLFAGLALGGSILTKGLAGVALVGLTHVIVLTLERRWKVSVVLGGALAVGAAVAIAAPWYLAMERLHPGYLHYYLLERHVSGFTEETERHSGRPFLYYVPILLGGGLPWILYLPFAARSVRHTSAGDDRSDDRAARYLGWTWLIGGWLFLSSAGVKLFTYVLPLFPAVALLASVAWRRWTPPGPPRHPGSRVGAALVLHAVVVAALVPVSAVAARLWVGAPAPFWIWVPAVLVAGCAWAAVHAWPAHRERSIRLATAATLLSMAAALAGVLPAAAKAMTGRDLAARLNRTGYPAELWVVRDRIGSVVFYASPQVRPTLTPDRIRTITPMELRMRTARPNTRIAVSNDDVRTVSHFVVLDGVPFVRAGPYRVYRSDDLGIPRRPRAP